VLLPASRRPKNNGKEIKREKLTREDLEWLNRSIDVNIRFPDRDVIGNGGRYDPEWLVNYVNNIETWVLNSLDKFHKQT